MVRIVDFFETFVQQNCVVALQSHGQPLKKKALLSVIAWGHTDFAAQNSEGYYYYYYYYESGSCSHGLSDRRLWNKRVVVYERNVTVCCDKLCRVGRKRTHSTSALRHTSLLSRTITLSDARSGNTSYLTRCVRCSILAHDAFVWRDSYCSAQLLRLVVLWLGGGSIYARNFSRLAKCKNLKYFMWRALSERSIKKQATPLLPITWRYITGNNKMKVYSKSWMPRRETSCL